MDEPTKTVFGSIRPIFILVAGWIMATAQTIRKHTNSIVRYDAFIMLPAYHVFYQAFIISALFYVRQYDLQKDVESGSLEMDEYRKDIDEMFGFVNNGKLTERYLIVSATVFAISLLFGVISAYLIKNNVGGWRPKTIKEYRHVFSIYSFANIGVCLLTFFVITASLT